jgi:hypothetical protein
VSRRNQIRLLGVFTVVWLGWGAWAMFARVSNVVLLVTDDLGVPISGAEVFAGDRLLGVTEEGLLEMEWVNGTLEVTAVGHTPTRLSLLDPPEERLEAVLKAQLLRGRVVDGERRPVAGAYVTSGAETSVTDAEGRFLVRKAEPGAVEVWRPAWEGTVFTWDGNPGEEEVSIAPMVLRAVHIGGEAAEHSWAAFVEMAHTTELNALMLDLKDETGLIFYQTEVALAHEVGAVWSRYDLASLAADAARNRLYLIGRIVVFQDPIASIRAPDLAVWNTNTDSAFHSGSQYFLDPTDPAAQAYALDLAREACLAGVDEIQFDYVRFPDSRPEWARFDGPVNPEGRIAAVRDFLATAVAELHPLGCAVAADVFGFTTTAIDDGGIGQRWEDVTEVLDVVSPMLYPSHYGSGWYGFLNPNDNPGPVVAEGLADGLERLSRQIVVRPWLQDFGYTPEQVREQIDEAEAQGLGWMLWNAASVFSVEALEPAE